MNFSFQRFSAYFQKESKQLIRDPSSILISFVLPLLMIFIFGFGVSLDADKIKIGLVLEDTSTEARSLTDAFLGTPYFDVQTSYDQTAFEDDLTEGHLRGLVTIPPYFSRDINRGTKAPLQILLDGSETNTAKFVLNYAEGVVANWTLQRALEKENVAVPPILMQPRVWFNPSLVSRNVLLPGSIAVIMTLIGTLLTALVVAREWERGTMEAMMSTPIRIQEMLLGKLMPYFLLGLISMAICVSFSVIVFGVPFRGSYFILFLATSCFLLAALGQGLLISTLTRNQFIAGQISIMAGFLPSFMLSGFIFEIKSMPLPIQLLTYLLPPRYFVTILQSSFLSGVPWDLLLPNLFAIILIALIFFILTARKTVKRLD